MNASWFEPDKICIGVESTFWSDRPPLGSFISSNSAEFNTFIVCDDPVDPLPVDKLPQERLKRDDDQMAKASARKEAKMLARCVLAGIAISSSAVLFGQGTSDRPQYISTAELTHTGRTVTIHASSPRPVEQAIAKIRRDYGLILDYEEGPVRESSALAVIGNQQVLRDADVTVTLDGPTGSSLSEQATFLGSVLSRFEEAGAVRHFTLLRGEDNRLTVTPTEATLRVLDTKILIDPRPRSIDATIEDIFRALNREAGIVIERGGLVDNELSQTVVTVGSSTTPIAARNLLAQALSGTTYAKFWILTWDPNTDQYAMNLQTAVKVDDTLTGVGREIPILTKPSH